MQLQEVYDKIKNHLLAQGERSMIKSFRDGKDLCAYRGEGGKMCAVGILITDEHYTPALEGKQWDEVEVITALNKSGVEVNPFEYSPSGDSGELCNLLGFAQDMHDNTEPEMWADALAEYAVEHGLRP